MAHRIPMTAAQIAEAKRLYVDEQLSLQNVSRRMGLGVEQVRMSLLREGVEMRVGAAALTKKREAA